MPLGQLRTVDPESGDVCCASVADDGRVEPASACC